VRTEEAEWNGQKAKNKSEDWTKVGVVGMFWRIFGANLLWDF